MANPFQDQFLKAGLADKTSVEKAKRKQRKQQQSRQKTRAPTGDVDEAQQRVLQASDQKAAHDRELNRQRHQEAKLKAVAAQIRQLIELNRIEPTAQTELFSFEDQGKIRQVEVGQSTRQQLVSGQLCIARLDKQAVVIPLVVANKIIQRDPEAIILANSVADAVADDDEYADYQVPDDLMW